MGSESRPESTDAARGSKRSPAKKHHHQGHAYAGSPLPIRRPLPPITQRRVSPDQGQQKKDRAGGFVEDLPGGAPERAEKAARLCDGWSGAFHALILDQLSLFSKDRAGSENPGSSSMALPAQLFQRDARDKIFCRTGEAVRAASPGNHRNGARATIRLFEACRRFS